MLFEEELKSLIDEIQYQNERENNEKESELILANKNVEKLNSFYKVNLIDNENNWN